MKNNYAFKQKHETNACGARRMPPSPSGAWPKASGAPEKLRWDLDENTASTHSRTLLIECVCVYMCL